MTQKELYEKLRESCFSQAQSVVHCGECEYLMFSDFYGECKKNHLNGVVSPNDYCSRGKRKGDDGK